MNRRVVITGIGVVSPIGNSVEDFTESLRQGSSGVGPITSFPTDNFPIKQAFEVKDFNARKHGTHLMDPFIQYAVDATAQALADADFHTEAYDPYTIGIAVSSSKGGVRTIDRFKNRFEKAPSAILGARIYTNTVPNFAAQWIARRWKLQGPAKCYVAACATGTVAAIEGARMVRSGIVDYCIAGASDASIVPLMLAGYRNMKALAPECMRPFDKNRNGFMVGEGAGILFFETLESAQKRGAKIYGELLESHYGTSCEHPLHFKDDALSESIAQVMQKTGWSASDIDYINLHGTATQTGDDYEARQIEKVFGEETAKISASSTKSMTGHMLGASGAVELVATLLAMKHGFVPPTIGLETLEEQFKLNVTPRIAKLKTVGNALSLSMGFGGHVAVAALRKFTN